MNTTEPFRPEERQTAEAPLLTGSQALIESFLREGVETLFGYPGGAIIPVYDALYDYRDRLRHILVRHEQGAVHAAQGYARVSGRVGVCLVTSGPGATNTVTGLADALMDSTPLVLVTGQVGSSLLGTDAFQETNFVGITQAVTKWNCQVKRTEDIPAAIAKAFYIAVRAVRVPSWSTSPRTHNAEQLRSATKKSPRSAVTSPRPSPTRNASPKPHG